MYFLNNTFKWSAIVFGLFGIGALTSCDEGDNVVPEVTVSSIAIVDLVETMIIDEEKAFNDASQALF